MDHFFYPIKRVDSRPDLQESKRLQPTHDALEKWIRSMRTNQIGRLQDCGPADSLSRTDSARFLNLVDRGQIWGLNLEIKSKMGAVEDKIWILKSVLWTKMIEACGGNSFIGYCVEGNPDGALFCVASLVQVPRLVGAFDGPGVLLCAMGPRGEEALRSALWVIENFNPSDYDEDGYTVAEEGNPNLGGRNE